MSAQTISVNPNLKTYASEFTGRIDLKSTAQALGNALTAQAFFTPVGTIIPFAGDVTGTFADGSSKLPAGYFTCDGTAISRFVYTDLFDVIGTTYGVGDGSTTFNLPNLKGRVPVGFDATQTYANTLAKTGGEEKHTLTIAQMPSHFHTGTTESAGTHTHTINDPGHSHSGVPNQASTAVGGLSLNAGNGSNTGTSTTGITINSAGAHVHTFTTNATGGGEPHENLPPYLVIYYIIKYA